MILKRESQSQHLTFLLYLMIFILESSEKKALALKIGHLKGFGADRAEQAYTVKRLVKAFISIFVGFEKTIDCYLYRFSL